MRSKPETIRDFLMTTTALCSRSVPLPACAYDAYEATVTLAEGQKGTILVPAGPTG